MARPRHSLKRTLLLSALAAVSLVSTVDAAMSAATSAVQASQADATATGATTAAITKATGSDVENAETDADTGTGTGSLATATAATTKTGTTTSSMPTLTSSSASGTAVSTYPAASVPPTANAPFMRQSSLPDGTVFIAVGSILGGLGLAVLIWRAVVGYMLHRSIARAAMDQHSASDKSAFLPPPAAFYKYSDRDSTANLAGGRVRGGGSGSGRGHHASNSVPGLAGRGVRRSQRGPTPSATPSQTNLFFSPTAPSGTGHNNAAVSTASNRDSRLLPAGFYVAGSGGSPNSNGNGGTTSINMSHLRSDSHSHGRAAGPSPPDSPAFGARSMMGNQNVSASSLNLSGLNGPVSGRAPSTFLDDLLDENPDLFPPAGQPHHRSYSHSSQGRI